MQRHNFVAEVWNRLNGAYNGDNLMGCQNEFVR